MEPSIVETTEKAIRILEKNPKGFFLLVEGEDGGFHRLTPVIMTSPESWRFWLKIEGKKENDTWLELVAQSSY